MFGMHNSSHSFLRSYLTDRKQTVSSSEHTSNHVHSPYSVPQGSVLNNNNNNNSWGGADFWSCESSANECWSAACIYLWQLRGGRCRGQRTEDRPDDRTLWNSKGVLGPMLFLLYTHPLSHIIDNHKVSHIEFADDSQLYDSVQSEYFLSLVSSMQLWQFEWP